MAFSFPVKYFSGNNGATQVTSPNLSNTTAPSYLLASFSTNEAVGGGEAGDAIFVDDIWFVYNKRIASLSIGGTAVASSVINSLNAQAYTNANGTTTNTFTSSTAIPTYDYTTGVCSDNFPAVTATTVSGFATASIFHAATASEPYVTIKITHTDNSYYYYKVRFTNVSSGPTITLNNGGTYNVCAGDPINVTASGATSYTWSNGLGNTATVHPTAAGNYTVTGTDANGCTATAVAYVTINSLPTITINGQASGSLSGCSSVALSASGAATPQNYNWSNGTSSTNTITVTQSGTYTVTGTNSYGCSATATANVTIHPLPTITITGPTTTCSDTTLTASGGVSYTWKDQSNNTVSTNATLPVSVGGTYTVEVTDANGCTNTASHTITINTTPTVNITGTPALCSGSSTTLNANSTPSGANFVWKDQNNNTLSNNATLTVTSGGTYSVTGTLNGCPSSAQVTVLESATPATPTLTGYTRCGAGQVNLSVNNPDNSLTYNWYLTESTNDVSHTGTTYTPTVNNTTTYYVSAQNAAGCSSSKVAVTATVNNNNDVLTTTPIIHCGPATVTLAANGNSNGTTLAWYSDAAGNNTVANTTGITANATDTFYVASIDGNNCRSALVPMVVTIHSIPSNPVPTQTEYCKGTEALPLSATTDPGTTLSWITPNGNAYSSITNASAGIYRVVANSSNCHSDTVSVTVTATPAIPTASDVTLCAAGTATLTVSNPDPSATYTWYANASHTNTVGTGSSVSVDVTGNSTFYITAKNGSCESSHKAVNVTIRETIPAPAIGNIHACGGSATLPADYNGNALVWKLNGSTVNELNLTGVTGTIAYTATYEVNGCTSQPATVNVAFAEVPVISAQGGSVCGSGTVTLTATSAGNTIHWFANETNANAFTNELATGGTYSPNVTTNTTYFVRALSAQGCHSNVASAVATVNPLPAAPTVTNITNCGPKEVVLTPAPSATIHWYTNQDGTGELTNGTLTVSATTTLYAATTDNNNCRSTLVPMVVTIHNVPSAPVPAQAEYCAGDGLNATTDLGTNLFWIAPNGTAYGSVSNASVGIYRVYAVNSSNCHSDTVSVTVTAIQAVPDASDVTICAAGTASLAVNNPVGGTTYTWYADANHSSTVGTGNSVSVNVTANATTFYVTAKNGSCESGHAVVNVTIRETIPAPAIGNIVACGGSATLPATSGSYSLSWKNASNEDVNELNLTGVTGTQSYTATYEVNGCTSQPATVDVTFAEVPAISAQDYTRCGNGAVTLTATSAGNTIRWFANEANANAFTNELATGSTYTPSISNTTTYYVRALSAQGCRSNVASAVATVNPLPTAPTVADITNCGTAQVVLTPAPSATIHWYTNQEGTSELTDGTLTVNATTTLYAATTDNNNCRSTLVPMVVTIHDVPSDPVPAQTEYCKGTEALPLSATTDPGTTLSWIAPNGTAYGSIANANAGIYRVVAVYDNTNCHSDTVSVTVTAKPAIPVANDVTLCAAGLATLTVSNPISGITYTWYANTSHSSIVGTGTSVHAPVAVNTTFYVTAKNGSCESSHKAVNVTIRETIPAPAISNIVACGGNATLPADYNGNALTWKLNGSPVGDLNLTGITGSATYTTTYEVNGCTSQPATVNVDFAEVPVISAQGGSVCGNGAVTLTATSAGNTIHWFANEANANAFTNELATGSTYSPNVSNTTTYFVRALSAQGCRSNVASATATVNPLPAAPTVADITNCGTAQVVLTPAPSAIIHWYTNQEGTSELSDATLTVNATTTLYAATTDNNNCRSTLVPMVVTIHDVPAAPVPAQTEYCKGTEVLPMSATTAPGTTLSWIAPNGTTYGSVANAVVGIYRVFAVNDNTNCHSDTVSVTVIAKPTIPVANDVTLCAAGLATLTVSNPISGTTYTWYANTNHSSIVGTGASVHAPVAVNTTFYVTAKNGGCESSQKAVNVTIRETIPAPAISNIVACGGNATLPADYNGSTLTWKLNGSPVGDLSLTGITGTASYTATYEVNGCTSQPATVDVTFAEVPVISAQGSSICGNGTVTLTATSAGNTIHWFANETNANAFTNELATGSTYTPSVSNTTTYYVRALSAQGCRSDVANAVATVNPLPAAPTVADIENCGAKEVVLTPAPSTTIHWYTNQEGTSELTDGTLTVSATTTLYAASTDNNNCRSTLVPMVVTIHDVPAQPATDTLVCKGDGNIALTATVGNGGTGLHWYTTLGGDAVMGLSYTARNAGTYYVASYNDHCESTPVAIHVVTKPAMPAADNVQICAEDESVQLTIGNPAAGTIYTWYADASHSSTVGTGASVTAPVAANAANATFYVSAKVDGCESDHKAVTVTRHSAIIAPALDNIYACGGNATLPADYNGSTLTWKLNGSPVSDLNLTGITGSATYTATYMADGCVSLPATVEVTFAEVPVISAQGGSICGNGSVALTAAATPEVSGTTFHWFASEANANAFTNELSTGSTYSPNVSNTTTYFVRALSAQGCRSNVANAVATVNPLPAAPTVADITNCGATEVVLTPAPSATIHWYTDQEGTDELTNGTLTVSATTTLYAATTDNNGCRSTLAPMVVTIHDVPAQPATDTLVCKGDGNIALTATVGNGGTGLHWYTTLGGDAVMGLSYTARNAGTYYVASYNDHCESTPVAIHVVTKPAMPAADNVQICAEDESVQLTIGNPAAGTIYTWYADASHSSTVGTGASVTAPVAANAANATFYVSAKVDGCESDHKAVTVTRHSAIIAPALDNIYACGGNATLPADYNGSTLTWKLNGSPVGDLNLTGITGTAAYTATYEVNGCTSQPATVDVTFAEVPVISAQGGSICGNGTVTLTANVTPEVSGTTFHWFANETNANAFSNELATGSTYTPSVSNTTTYHVRALSAQGCRSNIANAVATVNPLPAAPTVADITNCGTAEVVLKPAPSATIHWYTDQEGTNELTDGTLTVSATTTLYAATTDNNGCRSTLALMVVTIHDVPAAPVVNPVEPLCGSGSRTLSLSSNPNDYTINWYINNNVFNSNTYALNNITTSATYYASFFDGTCESAKDTIMVVVNTVPAKPTISAENLCGAGAAILTATVEGDNTGCQFEWYHGSTVQGLPFSTQSPDSDNISESTTYVVNNVNTTTHCQATSDPFTVTVYPTYELDENVTVCNEYVWNNETFRESGHFTRTLQTINGCDSVVTLNLTVNYPDTTIIDTTVCDLLTLYGHDYNTSGSYVVKTSDEGCGSYADIRVEVKRSTTSNTALSLCSNELPYTFNGTEIATAGTYTVVIPNAAGCDSTITLQVTVNPQPELTTLTGATRCGAGAVTLVANGTNGNIYQWYSNMDDATSVCQTASYMIENLNETHTYYVQLTNNETGCASVRMPVVATINPNPAVPVVTNQVRCGSGSVTFDATIDDNATTCRWYLNNSATAAVQHTGTHYDVTVSNTSTYYVESFNENTNCRSQRQPVTATVRAIPSLPQLADQTHCGPGTFTVSAPGEGTYQWYATAESNEPIAGITENTTPLLDVTSQYFLSHVVDYGDIVCESDGRTPITFTIFPVYEPQVLYDTVCQGTAYNNHGIQETFTTAGDFTRTLSTQSSNGCDSLVTLALHVKELKTFAFSDESCDSYVWNGQTYTTSGEHVQTITSSNGCDSTVTLTLTLHHSIATEFDATVCDSYTWNDQTYSISGDYVQHFQTVHGCDSTVTLHLTIHNSATTEFHATACDSHTWNDQTYTTSGDYVQHFQTVNGCDSTVTLHLTVNYSDNITYSDAVCAEEHYVGHGFDTTFMTAGTRTLIHHNTNVHGCDSTTTLTLTVNPVYRRTINQTICETASYNFNGRILSTAGIYYDTLSTVSGCDSMITLNLAVANEYETILHADICEGGVYNQNGFNESATGVYTISGMHAANGCDSTVVLHLNVHDVNTTERTASICLGETYSDADFSITPSTARVIDTNRVITTEFGCDSTIHLILTVNPVYHFTEEMTLCQSSTPFEYHGTTVNLSTVENRVVEVPFTTVNGCDSNYTLSLTILPSYDLERTVVICSDQLPYEFGGQNLTEGGVYTHNFHTTADCDSIIRLTLVVNPVQVTNLTADICLGETYNENGFHVTPTTSGILTQELQTQCVSTGCDSTVHLTLNVHPTYHFFDTVTVCQSTTPMNYHGTTIPVDMAQTRTVTVPFSTASGCDSIYTLTLKVNPAYHNNFDVTICQGERFTQHGFDTLITEAGQHTLISGKSTVEGCDSITTVQLTVTPIFEKDTTIAVCDNDIPYYWGNNAYYQAGDYELHFTPQQVYCDSIIRLHLQVNPSYSEDLTLHVCQGLLPYTIGNSTFTIADNGQTRTVAMTTSTGCDSILNVTFLVSAFTQLTERATVCDNELPYTHRGNSYNAAGTYEIVLPGDAGCDTVVSFELTVNPTYLIYDTLSVCSHELPVTYNNVQMSQAGTETLHLLTNAGCDSTVVVTLNVTPTPTSSDYMVVCENSYPIHYGDSIFAQAGTYDVFFHRPQGCDSIVTLTLETAPTYLYESTATICSYETYFWRGRTLATAGVYYDSLTTIAGCDSILALTLVVNPSRTIDEPAVNNLCAGETYTWHNINITTDGTYTDTVMNTQTNCYDVYRIAVHFNPVYAIADTMTICSDELPYTWNGRRFTAAGTQTVNYQASNGCDSTHSWTLFVNPTHRNNAAATICQSEAPYSWRGRELSVSGMYSDTLQTANGCDSIFTLALTVGSEYLITDNYTMGEGDSYNWHGRILTTSGTYHDSLTTSVGCDSVFVLNLTVNPSFIFNETASICDYESYSWRGRTLAATGVYYDSLTASTGMDSVYILTLTVNPSHVYTDAPVDLCSGGSYTWRGRTLTETGHYTDTVVNSFGCIDSYEVQVTVHPSYSFDEADTICDTELPYNWRGYTMTTAGTRNLNLQTVFGCDSSYHFTLVVNPTYSASETATICQSEAPYSWRGHEFSVSGTYSDTLQTANGCDSIFTLALTVGSEYLITDNYTMGEGDSYNWHGRILTTSGTYHDSLTTSVGCDSVFVLNLTVNPSFIFNETASICDYESYSWRGRTLAATGVYYDSLTASTGMDSVYILTLTVNPSHVYTDAPVDLCSGGSYTWRGRTLTETGHYTDTVVNSFGCIDSYEVQVTVHPSYSFDEADTICDTELPYNWRGYTMTAAGTRNLNLQTVFGCDSSYHFTLVVNPTYSTSNTVAISDGTLPYTWRGVEYNEEGTYSDTLQTVNGCDSILTLTLTVNPSYIFTSSEIICDIEPFTWRGRTLTETGIYYDSLLTVAGSDSVYVLNLTVNPSFIFNETATVCDYETYSWHGRTLTQSGTYYDSLQTVAGCDSVYVLALTVNPSHSYTDAPVDLCEGESNTWRGRTLTETGHYNDTVVNSFGCIDIYEVQVTVHPSYSFEEADTICDTELPYNWRGYTMTAAGTRNLNLQTVFGCDSSYHFTLVVNPTYSTSETVTISEGTMPYIWRGVEYNEEGTYSDTLQTVNGCDSILTLTLTVNPSYIFTSSEIICDIEPFTWRGRTLTETGIYYDSLLTVAGSDSVYVLNLTVNPSFIFNETATICDYETYSWHGRTLTQSGTYYDSLQTVAGCDSVYVLALTVNPSNTYTDQPVDLCEGESYTWRGRTLTETGTYTDTVVNNYGCQDFYSIHVTVHQSYAFSETDTICDNELPYSWRGYTMTAAGTRTLNLQTAFGCDSSYNFTLVVNPSYSASETATICQSEAPYSWRGRELSVSGIYHDSLQTVNGCDSVFTLALTVNPEYTFSSTHAICDNESFTWRGRTLNQTGVYYDSLSTTTGCDSVYVLNLQVNPSYLVSETATICSYETYSWRGRTLTQSGTYYDSLQTVNGCDSVFVLALTVNPSNTYTDQPVDLCAGGSYAWRGRTLTETGTYTDTVVNNYGCQDFYSIQVTVHQSYSFDEADTICDTELPYSWRGYTMTAAGTRTLNLQTAFGCDSSYHFTLVVNPSYSTSETATICQSEAPYSWRGRELSVSGIYHDSLQTVNGCDSVFTLALTVNPEYTFSSTHAICDNESFTWRGRTLNQTGVYYDSLSTTTGCDSVYVLNLQVNPSYLVNETATICSYETYSWHGRTLTQSGTYYDSLQTVAGCDSVYVLALTVNPSNMYTDQPVDLCTGSSYTWRGRTLTETGHYTDTVVNNYGCQDFYSIQVTVHQSYSFDEADTICDTELPYSWRGYTMTAAGTRTLNLQTAFGCDSSYHFTLVVNPSYNATETASICQSEVPYSWRGNDYTVSGVYSDTLQTVNGCDSILTLNLAVNPSVNSHDTAVVCSNALPYLWRGNNLMSSGLYTDTIPNSFGCQDVYHLLLTVNQAVEMTIYDTICQGDSYQAHGFDTLPSQYGVIYARQVLTSEVGCDSIVNLVLTVNRTYEFVTDASTCDNESYEWRGQQYTDAGTYYDRLTSSTGCDSVYVLNLTVTPTYEIFVEDSALRNHLYTGYGLTLTPEDSGTLTYDIQNYTINGCDSIIHLTLHVAFNYGIEQHTAEQREFTVYPNPATTVVNIKGEDMRKVHVYNALGKLVQVVEAEDEEHVQIMINGYAPGNYFLRILLSDGQIVNKKIIVRP